MQQQQLAGLHSRARHSYFHTQQDATRPRQAPGRPTYANQQCNWCSCQQLLHNRWLQPRQYSPILRGAHTDTPHSIATLDINALYTRQVYTPNPVINDNLEVQLLHGQGAGLVATGDHLTGDLLLAAPALAIVYGPVGQMPDSDALVDAILRNQADLQPHELRWLELLRMERTTGASHTPEAPTPITKHSPGHNLANASAMGSQSSRSADQASPTWEQQCQELQALLRNNWQPSTPTSSGSATASGRMLSIKSMPDAAQRQEGTVAALGVSPLSPSVSTPSPQELSNVSMVGIMEQSRLSRDWVAEAVACNVTGEAREDIAVAELRQQEPLQSYLGLFPHYALINHSCAPNTAHVVVGGYILVHAARPISAGEQLTTCYLAGQRFSHVAARRAALRQQFGFHCACERCLLEQQLFPTTYSPADSAIMSYSSSAAWRRLGWSGRVMQWTLDRLFGQGRYLLGAAPEPGLLAATNQLVREQLAPSLQEALAAAPGSAAQQRKRLLGRLLLAVERVETAIQALGLEPREALLLQASCFNLYQLVVEWAQLMPTLVEEPSQVQALQRACRVCDAVARGTDSQLFLSTAAWTRLQQLLGRESPEARFEQLSCTTAHYARYGHVSKALLQELMQVRRKTAIATVLGQRLGVLAWDTAAEKS